MRDEGGVISIENQMFNKIVLFVISMSFSLLSFSSLQTQGKVKGFYINKDGTALLKLDVNIAACGTNGTGGWDFHYDTANTTNALLNQVYNQWTSMILAAQMSSTEIRLGYEPNSSEGTYCEISYVYFYNENL